ncbi:glycosyltransferase family 2 protein [Sulfuracidifex metallicus]|uniref:glycosyltransferase family 2 protein n=1 Tax=Sulfuracidifex metallicus TaxID=47303 RepID=UPI002275DD95|nr:glycosyltransferase family 2 protein [Sulfuracidifex metallicus]MCY0849834.1 glycosyltransferase [Sulfuracidifex metallicus]
MPAFNWMLFSLPFIASAILTWLTLGVSYLFWLNFLVWLSTFTGVFIFINFMSLSRGYDEEMNLTFEVANLRVASLVTSFNEDPEMVEATVFSVMEATRGRGDVYLLDDSTNTNISQELRNFCYTHNIIYVHREDRKGFKAGAINNVLRSLRGYDVIAIFDADQRPKRNFFDDVLQYFSDPNVAMVQVPQVYSESPTLIAKGSIYQQEPFLRLIMRGRNRRSAFSLGSGSVFRFNALRDVNFFDEESITEDAATTIRLYQRGYKVVYVDTPLIWYGEPPKDASAFISQQTRWALGYFQLLRKLLRSNLKVKVFFDFIAGFFYWLKEGPLALIELIAPLAFLLFGLPFIVLNPIIYILAYLPYIIISIILFFYAIREKNYGIKGFLYHQFVEYLEFFGITTAFLAWVLRRKVPFRVTPKGKGRVSLRVIIPHLSILILLIISIVKGILELSMGLGTLLVYSIYVNLFWASYQSFFLSGSIFLAVKTGGEEEKANYIS